ncbi:MAG TPA: hypothetical protein VFJ13_10535 [Paracoccaceae bacterium]|nr:hypothetical protein [Paracoccaceae bacterium]
MKTLLMSTAAVLFVAGTAYAEDVRVLIDADEDGQITVEEWDASRAEMDNVFGEWDADADNFLTQEEYQARLEMQDDADSFGTWDDRYAAWDTDADGMLSVDEYNAGLWDVYDADEDGMWSMDEAGAFQEHGLNYDAVRSGADVSQ